ncbi:MAG: hypothetical protein KatS3mg109_2099 [Pirellulaceae bacterium]|nr:MAG: hypothetical protein KatS3mg109_2099 [Pirellulaceae bacterium]
MCGAYRQVRIAASIHMSVTVQPAYQSNCASEARAGGNESPREVEQTSLRRIRRNLPRFGGWAYLAVLVVGLLIPNRLSYPARWEGHAMDFLHVPAFALLAWALGVLTRRVVVGITTAVAVATLAELAQAFVGRQPSLGDWLLGMCGCATTAVWTGCCGQRMAWRVAATALLIGTPLAWKMPHFIDAIYFASSFPVLSDFRSPFETSRWYVEENRLERVRLADGSFAGKAEFLPSPKGESAVIVYSFYQDWSAYRYVKCEFSVEERPIRLLLSIRNPGNHPDAPHYDLVGEYQPGRHMVSIDLAEAARGGVYPKIDLRRVQGYYLVMADREPRELIIHRIWLE